MNYASGKNSPFVNGGVIICVIGTLAIVAFALGLETKGSWAEQILCFLLKYRLAVILGLCGAGAACFLPFLKYFKK